MPSVVPCCAAPRADVTPSAGCVLGRRPRRRALRALPRHDDGAAEHATEGSTSMQVLPYSLPCEVIFPCLSLSESVVQSWRCSRRGLQVSPPLWEQFFQPCADCARSSVVEAARRSLQTKASGLVLFSFLTVYIGYTQHIVIVRVQIGHSASASCVACPPSPFAGHPEGSRGAVVGEVVASDHLPSRTDLRIALRS